MTERRAFGGILVRKECWTLSLKGKGLVLLAMLAGACAAARGLYPFLAVTSRTSGEIMVVEGWIQTQSIGQVAEEYAAARYLDVLVVNEVYPAGNKWDSGRYRTEYIVEELIRRGVPKDRMHTVHCDVVGKDRTYQMALAAREWVREHGPAAKSIDVVTLGPHARRSRLLFQKAFRSDMKVGVIAMDERLYDPVHWWRSSEGMRQVLFEGLAYAYALCFFRPS